MVGQDQYLEEVFDQPPMVAFKRQRNQKDMLINAKVPLKKTREGRILNGMKNCGKCSACPYVYETKTLKTYKNKTWKLMNNLTCESENVIYLLKCDKDNCKLKYVGETERKFKERMKEHLGYARTNDKTKVTGRHFNLPGHSIADMKFTILEKVRKKDTLYRKEREKFHINTFKSYYNGLNVKPC